MRYGVCASSRDVTAVSEAGFDYIELSVANELVPHLGEAEWAEKRPGIERMEMTPEVFNIFVRGGQITGPDADPEWLQSYVRRAFSRAAEVGGEVIVLGSGPARTPPEDFPAARARAQLRNFLEMCDDAFNDTGVTLALEPLNRSESTLITHVAEGAVLVRELAMPGVRLLADTYHMERENEPLEVIGRLNNLLAHVHTADSGRLAPGTGDGNFEGLFRNLLRAGYDQRVSIECDWQGEIARLLLPARERLVAAEAAARESLYAF